jgi:hypothetical protein
MEVRPAPVLDASLCRQFALRGTCRYKNDCHYSHLLPDDCADWNEACQRIPCPHYGRGICRYGTICRLAHCQDTYDSRSQQCSYHPESLLGSTDHGLMSRSGTDIVDVKKAAATATATTAITEEDNSTGEEIICGICLEPLGQTKNNEGSIKHNRKKFGLLSSCDHIFCVQCLRTWRQQKKEALNEERDIRPTDDESGSVTVRACPACRQPSDFIVPSDRFCVGQEKEQVVSAYKARLSCTPCKRFNGKLGSCPFGKDCFYAHWDGKENMKKFDKTKQELWQEKAGKQRLKAQRRRLQHHHLHFPDMTQTEMDAMDDFIYLISIGMFFDPLDIGGIDVDDSSNDITLAAELELTGVIINPRYLEALRDRRRRSIEIAEHFFR